MPLGSTGTSWELMIGSRRMPDRPIELDDPSVSELLQRTIGRGAKMNLDRHSYWDQSSGRRKFVIGIPLTKSPGDGINGEVQFTGENLVTGSLVSIQQKGLTGLGVTGRVFICNKDGKIVAGIRPEDQVITSARTGTVRQVRRRVPLL